jgi:hypothetical protein
MQIARASGMFDILEVRPLPHTAYNLHPVLLSTEFKQIRHAANCDMQAGRAVQASVSNDGLL